MPSLGAVTKLLFALAVVCGVVVVFFQNEVASFFARDSSESDARTSSSTAAEDRVVTAWDALREFDPDNGGGAPVKPIGERERNRDKVDIEVRWVHSKSDQLVSSVAQGETLLPGYVVLHGLSIDRSPILVENRPVIGSDDVVSASVQTDAILGVFPEVSLKFRARATEALVGRGELVLLINGRACDVLRASEFKATGIWQGIDARLTADELEVLVDAINRRREPEDEESPFGHRTKGNRIPLVDTSGFADRRAPV